MTNVRTNGDGAIIIHRIQLAVQLKCIESLDRNYRLSKDLIQVSEIKEVLEKYDIGKRYFK